MAIMCAPRQSSREISRSFMTPEAARGALSSFKSQDWPSDRDEALSKTKTTGTPKIQGPPLFYISIEVAAYSLRSNLDKGRP